MAKKNNSGWAGMDFVQIMQQQAQQQLDDPKYCRYCGKDINFTYTSADDKDWELHYSAHTGCHRKHSINRGNYR